MFLRSSSCDPSAKARPLVGAAGRRPRVLDGGQPLGHHLLVQGRRPPGRRRLRPQHFVRHHPLHHELADPHPRQRLLALHPTQLHLRRVQSTRAVGRHATAPRRWVNRFPLSS
ncbi:hypothetical protein AVEN_31439-1 [Araneus ventricosus]|uniref:Uncharacterized protein n=1 Tax=Araneus ventricosus TaxID=182803 RepID=A0A4Y2PI09_ARAVE|nr:hypothetical protein AVEN_31439-1 [Araneus ventricosus]